MHNTVIDVIRLEANAKLHPVRKSEFGQFMTPTGVADFMAGLFTTSTTPVRLLDAGAGVGSLTSSAAKALGKLESITAWEIDPIMHPYLEANLEQIRVPFIIKASDFIKDSVISLKMGTAKTYTHAILNPPYKKMSSNSEHRHLLRKLGIETVNLYSAFLALTIMLMEDNGEIVVIIPRSFCNGQYYKPFRSFLLATCSIEHIHIFESRKKTFKDDNVLQENVILKLVKGKQQETVTISCCHDASFKGYTERHIPFFEVVKPDDDDLFIHVPRKPDSESYYKLFSHTLTMLDLEVCTGPVVDFRLKGYWLDNPKNGAIPLIYPHHFNQGKFQYPKEHHKKPNALRLCPTIEKWLMPKGFYVLVKRFSAKEEKKRVTAHVITPNDIPSHVIGFENHWNVFHFNKRGIAEQTAKGMACILNSSMLDQYFREFSGHTQVNATDLRNMKYPSLIQLQTLGKVYQSDMSQTEIDGLIKKVL